MEDLVHADYIRDSPWEFQHAREIQALVDTLGWRGAAVFREKGWTDAFKNQILDLRVKMLGEIVTGWTAAVVKSSVATKVPAILRSTGAAVWILWSTFWWVCHQ